MGERALDIGWVALTYLASLLSVVYSQRGQGKKAVTAGSASLAFLLASTYCGTSSKSVAERTLVVILVSFASVVIFVLRKKNR